MVFDLDWSCASRSAAALVPGDPVSRRLEAALCSWALCRWAARSSAFCLVVSYRLPAKEVDPTLTS